MFKEGYEFPKSMESSELIPWKRDLEGDIFVANVTDYYDQNKVIDTRHQLHIGGGGFGSQIGASGRKLFCYDIMNDGSETLSRYDVLGLLPYSKVFEMFDNPRKSETIDIAFTLLETIYPNETLNLFNWNRVKDGILNLVEDIKEGKVSIGIDEVNLLKDFYMRIKHDEPEYFSDLNYIIEEKLIEEYLEGSGSFEDMIENSIPNISTHDSDTAQLAYYLSLDRNITLKDGLLEFKDDTPIKRLQFIEQWKQHSSTYKSIMNKAGLMRENLPILYCEYDNTRCKYVKGLEGNIHADIATIATNILALNNRYDLTADEYDLGLYIDLFELNMFEAITLIKLTYAESIIFGVKASKIASMELIKAYLELLTKVDVEDNIYMSNLKALVLLESMEKEYSSKVVFRIVSEHNPTTVFEKAVNLLRQLNNENMTVEQKLLDELYNYLIETDFKEARDSTFTQSELPELVKLLDKLAEISGAGEFTDYADSIIEGAEQLIAGVVPNPPYGGTYTFSFKTMIDKSFPYLNKEAEEDVKF